jgi:HSP20 family molecular chaperone IbpA
LDITGYNPKSIKTEWKDNKLIVSGREEVRHEGVDDFSVREFKKTYELPPNAEPEKLVSFATHGQIVFEVPLKNLTPTFTTSELYPQIQDQIDGGKQVYMNCSLPTDIDPKKVQVTCKDRDIIIKAEDIKKRPDGISKMHYYKRSTLPPNTKFEELKCTFDNNKLEIKAPLDLEYKPHHIYRTVPIEWTKSATPQVCPTTACPKVCQ